MISPLATGLWIATWVLALATYLHFKRRARHLRREEQLIMSRARQKALGIVTQARDQALNIIAHAKISANTDKLKLEENLDKISADQLREFQKLISNISKNIESDAVKGIGEFTQALELETVQSQKVVAQKIEDQYSQVQQELAEMKQQRLAQLNTQINVVLKEVITQIAGKVIPLDEHEKLIISALDEARRKNAI